MIHKAFIIHKTHQENPFGMPWFYLDCIDIDVDAYYFAFQKRKKENPLEIQFFFIFTKTILWL